MEKVQDIVAYLNPGQEPIITADQPIYALAKQVQWHWPEQYGEDNYLVMFRGLHVEITALRSIGTLLHGSGWTGALAEAGVASIGIADSYLSVASVTRTRQMHQVTACGLDELLKAAYTDYYRERADNNEDILGFEEWCESR